ncbi:M81 family metallopeptidase [Curtobacterium sp. MMLR14_010]|uniref:M81 family metallopeptidase n=1 Tax=Curtobacterium sp. MMLR14_010 TaxID=1898743 RepID=UPI0009F367CA|nr:M81 family metallopeptidase [Curtobacterium sp. MMLR14_010]
MSDTVPSSSPVGSPAGSPVASPAGSPVRRPVIAIAGLAIETSTFTPTRTQAEAFHPDRGDEVVARYDFLAGLSDATDFRGALIGHALPGGMVTREAYESLASEIVTRLTALVSSTTVDGLWFDIHGAMVVEGLDDAESDLLGRIRAVIGPDVIVSASMDLHGNVTAELAHQVDLVTCYRMAPHEDAMETKERAVRNLVDVLATRPVGSQRPVKAWVPIPVLLPGEQTSTRIEPAASLYAQVPEVEAVDGVLDAAIWVGYAWADQPRDRAVTVVTGWDRDAVAAGAERLARAFWDVREDFVFVAPTGSFAECLDAAVAPGAARPYFVSDSGDNPTAGGSGDMTWGLTEVLARPEFRSADGPTVIYASVPGPDAVATAVAAGVGATVTVTAGAAVDDVHAGPITMTGRVHAIKHGDRDAETEVVLQVGSVFAILTTYRKPYHHEHDFTDLDLAPRQADVVIVKIGYLEPELFDMAADWMLALTPGGVDQDLERLGHHRIARPMFPYDRVFPSAPDLGARIIPPSNEPLGAIA